MVRVRVKLFSLYRDLFKSSELELEVDGKEIKVRDVIKTLTLLNARFERVLERFPPVILVRGLPVKEEDKVKDGDEVVFLPPASGGLMYKLG